MLEGLGGPEMVCDMVGLGAFMVHCVIKETLRPTDQQSERVNMAAGIHETMPVHFCLIGVARRRWVLA